MARGGTGIRLARDDVYTAQDENRLETTGKVNQGYRM